MPLVMVVQTASVKHLQPDSGKVSTEQKNLALKEGIQDMVNGHINHNSAVTASKSSLTLLSGGRPGEAVYMVGHWKGSRQQDSP
jgi:hypothetical protein